MSTESVEIYIRGISSEEAVRWLQSVAGPLVVADTIDSIVYLRDEADTFSVTITPRIEEGEFLSVYVAGSPLPWSRSEDVALLCARQLDKTVRWCDESSNQWMEAAADGRPISITLAE